MQQPRPGRSLDGMSRQRPPDTTTQQNSYVNSPPPEAEQQNTGPGTSSREYDEIEHINPQIENDGPGPSQNRQKKPRKNRRFFSWRKLIIAGSIFLLSAVAIAGVAFWYVQSNLIVGNLDGGSALLQEDADPEKLNGEGDGRINALLMGVDDSGGLTDTIILVSFDPIAKDVVMLSIPRDLYVEIDGYGSAKINAAHAYGERYGYQGGGPQLLKDTVSDILDVPIHYYGRVDFEGFEKAVNIVGGVTVEIEEELNDPYYPDEDSDGHEPFHIEAGTQRMSGETALRYVRSRKTTSDFDRSRRQQEVLLALRQKVLSRGTLANPSKVTGLLNTLSGNAETNMKVKEIMRLIELGKGVGAEDITTAQLDASENNFLTFSNIYGQSALVPTAGSYSEIRGYVRTLMVDSYIKDEAAEVSVLNGTTRPGLANDTADLLRSYGYDVVNVDNAANQDYAQTVIFNYNSDNPYTLRYLEQRFDVKAQRRQGAQQDNPYDIEVVLGSDYDPSAE